MQLCLLLYVVWASFMQHPYLLVHLHLWCWWISNNFIGWMNVLKYSFLHRLIVFRFLYKFTSTKTSGSGAEHEIVRGYKDYIFNMWTMETLWRVSLHVSRRNWIAIVLKMNQFHFLQVYKFNIKTYISHVCVFGWTCICLMSLKTVLQIVIISEEIL